MLSLFKMDNLVNCIDLYYNIFTSPNFSYNWITKASINQYFLDTVNTPKFLGFCYFNKDKLIGACFGTINDYFLIKQYYIKEIFVDRRVQNKGIGSQMLKEIEIYLSKINVENIVLLTSKDIHAYDFYIKHGFVNVTNTVYLTKNINI